MAKTNAQKKKNGRSSSPVELEKQIGRLDRDLLGLLNERARQVELLGRARIGESMAPFDITREAERIEEIVAANKGPLADTAVRATFREVNAGARALVKTVRVSYLGPLYSYSHQAAIERFGTSAELVPVGTIAAVFEELRSNQADYGIVPIENSTDGRIVDTLGMFARHPARICGEVQLRIHHYLIAKCTRADVNEVYSKPQALSQCREWLTKHLPHARLVEMTSTAAAAQLSVDRFGAAAVASKQAALNYGLNILAEDIEDNRNNVTRFAVIGGETPRRTGADKTAIMLELQHRPGTLADTMTVFKRNRLNLTWIESFPMPGTKSEYLFFVECEGHQADSKVKRALTALGRRAVRLEVLGSYARTEPIE